MTEETPKSGAPAGIAEKAGHRVIPALKEEFSKTEEAALIEEKKRLMQSRPQHRSGVKRAAKFSQISFEQKWVIRK